MHNPPDIDVEPDVRCPQEMKDLWAAAHQALQRYAALKEHPTCPELQHQFDRFMVRLRAAATRAESVMDAELRGS